MIRSLQEKYLSLEKKEQRYLQVCGVAIFLFIIYQFIFTPYQASMAKIDNQLSYQSKLNIWLRSVEPKLKQLHDNAKKINVSKSSLLSITSSSLKQSILKSYQHELQQSDNEIIQLKIVELQSDINSDIRDEMVRKILNFSQDDEYTIIFD